MRTRLAPVMILAVALALSSTLPAQAAPLFSKEPHGWTTPFLKALGKLPARLLSFWEKEGSGVDPFGGNPATPPPPDEPGATDEGKEVPGDLQ